MNPAKELDFEAHVTGWLLEHGESRSAMLAASPTSIGQMAWTPWTFLSSSRRPSRKEWNRLVDSGHGGDPVLTRAKFVQRLASQLDKRGTVDVLRRGGGSQRDVPVGVLQTGSRIDARVDGAVRGQRAVGHPSASI